MIGKIVVLRKKSVAPISWARVTRNVSHPVFLMRNVLSNPWHEFLKSIGDPVIAGNAPRFIVIRIRKEVSSFCPRSDNTRCADAESCP